MMQVADTVDIVLSSGDIASIEMSSELLKRIRQAYNLDESQRPTASQVKFFLAKSMQNALEIA